MLESGRAECALPTHFGSYSSRETRIFMDRLSQARTEVRDRTSLYWSFYEPEAAIGADELVEVRLNGSPQAVQSLQPPDPWSVDRVQWGEAVYLRRLLLLSDDEVEAMLIQMLELADATRMQVHSWRTVEASTDDRSSALASTSYPQPP